MGDQQVTSTNQVGPQGQEARDILPMLQQLAQQAGVELGDLSDLASGNLRATASDRNLVTESANLAADVARRNAERDYRMVRGQTEDAILGRGLDESTVGAILDAIQGGQYQTQLANIGSQQQGQVAQGLMTMPLQRADAQISANQAILQRILGASQGVLGYDIQQRLGNQSTTETRPFDWAAMGQTIGQGAAAVGGAS